MVRQAEEVRDAPPPPRRSLARGLLHEARPKQWAKNVLVFAAPGAAGVLDEAHLLVETLIAFVAFCLASAGTYFVNDLKDLEADRRHPTKCRRPIAAGEVPVGLAQALAPLLIFGSIALAFVASPALAATIAGYLALTTAYSAWLKHVVILDMVAVATGFVLRAIAGATATGVPVSNWFFITASFGSLFMVAGKRYAESLEIGTDASTVRATLGEYTPSYLAYLRAVSSGAVLVAYCLWAFEKAAESDSPVPWYQLSILPFVVAILRYALLLDQGKGSAPEELIMEDRTLQIVGLVWIAVFGIGVYTAAA
ncbi:MAG: decaprenyl-phosphate phosphoribosyltransferase [Acidimicrobiia bacterium]